MGLNGSLHANQSQIPYCKLFNCSILDPSFFAKYTEPLTSGPQSIAFGFSSTAVTAASTSYNITRFATMPLTTKGTIVLVVGTVFMVAAISALIYFGCWRSTRPFQVNEMRRDIDLEAQRNRDGVELYGRRGIGGQSNGNMGGNSGGGGNGNGNSGRVFREADDGFETRSLKGGKVVR